MAGLKVKAIPMNHPVPAVGFAVSDGTSSFVYSADTGPNEALWKEAAKMKNLNGHHRGYVFPEQPGDDRRSQAAISRRRSSMTT